jgi:hypothetical protein
MNITFEITFPDNSVRPTTFLSINAISRGDTPATSIIYSNGQEFITTLSYGEVWEKLKKHQDESAARK